MIQIGFTQEQKEKLGNTLVYLTQGMPLGKTQILKLIYLLDEYAIKITGVPFFNFDYKAWKLGPVKQDLFVDLSNSQPIIFKGFIKAKGQKFIPVEGIDFIDDEFTDFEMELLEQIKSKYATKYAKALVRETHKEGRPWDKAVRANGLLELYNGGRANISDVSVEMASLVESDPLKLNRYKEYLSNKGAPN